MKVMSPVARYLKFIVGADLLSKFQCNVTAVLEFTENLKTIQKDTLLDTSNKATLLGGTPRTIVPCQRRRKEYKSVTAIRMKIIANKQYGTIEKRTRNAINFVLNHDVYLSACFLLLSICMTYFRNVFTSKFQ